MRLRSAHGLVRFGPGLVPIWSRFGPGLVPAWSRSCHIDSAFFEFNSVCIRSLHLPGPYAARSLPGAEVSLSDKRNSQPQEKPKKIKEMNPPGGCVLCGGFKGPAAALAAGALRAPVSVRGTLTKSAGRPRRRSRWEQPPRPKSDAATKAKGRPRAAFCFGAGFLRMDKWKAIKSSGAFSASPSTHCSYGSANPGQLP